MRIAEHFAQLDSCVIAREDMDTALGEFDVPIPPDTVVLDIVETRMVGILTAAMAGCCCSVHAVEAAFAIFLDWGWALGYMERRAEERGE